MNQLKTKQQQQLKNTYLLVCADKHVCKCTQRMNTKHLILRGENHLDRGQVWER